MWLRREFRFNYFFVQNIDDEIENVVEKKVNLKWNRMGKVLRNVFDSIWQYFTELAPKLINKENAAFDQTKLTPIIPEQEPDGAFVIKHTTFTEVNKFIFELIVFIRNDCPNGFDNIPVKFNQPVAEDITSPIVNIINSSINKEIFPDSWKMARVCPVPKIDNPINEKDFRPISILPVS